MRKRPILSCLAASAAVIVIACAALAVIVIRSGPSDDELVEIRIQNNMDGEMSDLWLGMGPGYEDYLGGLLGEGSTSFGEIGRGDTTAYRSVPRDYQYFGATNFVIDGKRYFHNVSVNHRGGTDYVNLSKIELGDSLPLGKYTFAYLPSDEPNVANLVITKDK
ncbi:MAG: hypothetical protein AAF902_11310 [Chloroflexota bacterium]